MKHAKKAFLASLLSVVLCVTMLVGTTYAWFTDSVTSAGNKIIAGNLDIDLYQHDGTSYVEITDNSAPIFGSSTSTIAQNNNADTLWEPGKTQVAYLKLQNNGSLALKYQVALKVTNPADGKNLYKAMRYKIVPDAQPGSVTSWVAAPGTANTVVPGTQIASGSNTTDTYPGVMMGPNDEHYFALVIHMMEEAGNEYQGGSVEFDLQVIATQQTDEADSFDNQYDKDAKYLPEITVTQEIADTNDSLTLSEGNYTATIPAEAVESGSTYKLDVEDKSVTTTAETTTVEFDATLYKDDVPVETNQGIVYTLTKNIGPGQEVISVTHKGEAVIRDDTNTGAANTFYYDTVSGILTVYVSHFSPFEAVYKKKVSVESIILDQDQLLLSPMASVTITAEVSPANASFKNVLWTSSDDAVATVANGVVTGVGEGTAIITGTADGISSTCAVTVMVPVAMIGEVAYDSIQAAFDDATEGQTILLCKNVELSTGLVFNKNVTAIFDLQNHTISNGDNTVERILSVSSGSLSLQNGSIQNINPNTPDTLYGVYFSGSARAEAISDVNISVNGTGIKLAGTSSIGELNATIEGRFELNGSNVYYDAVHIDEGASINEISGGSYRAIAPQSYLEATRSGRSINPSHPLYVEGTVTLISGGTFAYTEVGVNNLINNAVGTIGSITGGTFTWADAHNSSGPIWHFANASHIGAITGGTFAGTHAPKNTFNLTSGTHQNAVAFREVITNSGATITETEETMNYTLVFSSSLSEKTVPMYEVVSNP